LRFDLENDGTHSIMVVAHENRPGTGTGRIKTKSSKASKASGRAAEKRRRKPTQDKPDQRLESTPEAFAVATETLPDTIEVIEEPVVAMDPPAAPDAETVAVAQPVAPAPVSVRTITDAYGDYTRKSIEQTSWFFRQLAGTRSLNTALEVQTAFARTAFETFVDESRKIRDLHRELAKQRLQGLEGFVMGRRAAR
jgi:hypothetical protein